MTIDPSRLLPELRRSLEGASKLTSEKQSKAKKESSVSKEVPLITP